MGSSVTVVKWSRRAAQKHLPRDRHGEKQEISKWKWGQRHAGARRLDLPQAAAPARSNPSEKNEPHA